jgi:hypothetical protein
MSQGGQHNLYELAFGLPAETSEPDPYTLLKLDPFTSDSSIIEQAVLQRWSDLQLLQGFGDGSEVTQLESEVNAARDLLLDDARRQELDEKLRQQGLVAPEPKPEPDPKPEPLETESTSQEPKSELDSTPETPLDSAADETYNVDDLENSEPEKSDRSQTDGIESTDGDPDDSAEQDQSSDSSEPTQQSGPERKTKPIPVGKLAKLAAVVAIVVVGFNVLPQLVSEFNFDDLLPIGSAENSNTEPTEDVVQDSTKQTDSVNSDTPKSQATHNVWDTIQLDLSDARIEVATSSKDGTLIAIGTDDKRLRIVSATDPQRTLLKTEPLQLDELNEVQFSEDQSTLFASSFDAVQIWRKDVEWKPAGRISYKDTSHCLLSRDGKKLAIVPQPNSEVVVFDLTKPTPIKSIRKTSNFVQAAFVGDGSRLVTAGDFGVPSAANQNYSVFSGLPNALIQMVDTTSGEFTELLNIPSLGNKASKIRAIAGTENALGTVLAALISVDSNTQQLVVWELMHGENMSHRYEVSIETLGSISGLRLSIDDKTETATVMTETGFVIFKWKENNILFHKPDSDNEPRIVDINSATNRVLAIGSQKENTLQTVSFDKLRLRFKELEDSKSRVSVVRNVDDSQSARASFWKAEENNTAPWVKTHSTHLDVFTEPRCRVQFVNDNLFVVRQAASAAKDRLVGFDASTDPPSKRFETEIETSDLLAFSPDHRYLLRLTDQLDASEISAFELKSLVWSRSVKWATTRSQHLAFTVTDWPTEYSWQDLIELPQATSNTVPASNSGLQFSQPKQQRSTPYVYFGIVGTRWYGTLGLDIRELFQGLPSAVGESTDAWPAVVSEHDVVNDDGHITRVEFSEKRDSAICQYVSDSTTNGSSDDGKSILKRLIFHKNTVQEAFRTVANIGYRDLWSNTTDDNQAVVTNRGGLLLCRPTKQHSMGKGQLKFNRGNDRFGALDLSDNGHSMLLIDQSGMAKLLSWHRSRQSPRHQLGLSRERFIGSSQSDSWVKLRPAVTASQAPWRRLSLEESNIRLSNRRLSTSVSPSGNRIAVGTPDGVLFWNIPESFTQNAARLAAQQTKPEDSRKQNEFRSKTLKPIVDLTFSGNQLVASLQNESAQMEFFRFQNAKYSRVATASFHGTKSRVVDWSSRSSGNGIAIATNRGELFLVPELTSVLKSQVRMKPHRLATNSPAKFDSKAEHPAAIRTISTSTGCDLIAYSTPKGYFLVDAKRATDQIHKVSISDPEKPAFVAFSKKVGERRTTNGGLMADLRYTRITGGQRGYKLYLHSVNRRTGKWQVNHLVNTELGSNVPIGNPVVLEISETEALVVTPTSTGALLYSLVGKKLLKAPRLLLDSVTTMAVSSAGDQIALGTSSGIVQIWGTPTFDLSTRPKSTDEILDVLTNSEPASSSNLTPRVTVPAHSDPISALAFEPNGQGIVSGSIVGELIRWSTSAN